MKRLHTLLAAMACMLLANCAITEELMIGQGKGLDAPSGTKIPNNPALVAAMAGNKVYRTRHFLLAGDHVIKTSSGSEYNHAQTASWRDTMQTLGVAVVGWSQASIAKAKEVTAQLEAGEITKREASAQAAAIQQAELSAKSGAYESALGAGAEATVGPVTPP